MPNSIARSGRPTDGLILRARRLFRLLFGPWGRSGTCVLTIALGLGGCVERVLLITSDPIGAHVTVNGKDAGSTPVTIPFVHNQRFEYRIEKDGYRSVADDVTAPSTWDSVPGPDFFAENVYPGHIRRQTVRHVTLERLPSTRSRADLEAILRQAEAFRVRANTETGGPDVPPPTRADRLPAANSAPRMPPAPTPELTPQGTPQVSPQVSPRK